MEFKTNGQNFSLFPIRKIHIMHFLGVNLSIYSNLIGQNDIKGRHPLAEAAAIQQMVRSRL